MNSNDKNTMSRPAEMCRDADPFMSYMDSPGFELQDLAAHYACSVFTDDTLPTQTAFTDVFENADNFSTIQGESRSSSPTQCLDPSLLTLHERPLPLASRRRRTTFSEHDRKLLLDAFDVDPYPSDSSRLALARACSVHIHQIDTWFANKRSRANLSNKPKKAECSQHSGFKSDSPVNLTETNLAEMLKQLDTLENQLPIEKYLHTPLEEERADVSRLQQYFQEDISTESSRHDSFFHSTSGPASVASLTCAGSVCSSRGSKKGRRQYQSSVKTLARTKDGFFRRLLKTEGRRFYCTFCGQSFRHHYEWKRHEESMHVPQKVWVCVLPACSTEHLDQRTFFRKDNFLIHVRRCHGFPEDATSPASPLCIDQFGVSLGQIPPHHPILKCGFCGKVESSWERRISHISKHFKDGIDLSSWWLRRLDCLSNQRTLTQIEPNSCVPQQPQDSNQVHVWSCRLLANASSAFDELNFCQYCSLFYADGPTSQLQHMIQEHKYRACEQDLFYNIDEFHQHLVQYHYFEQPCGDGKADLFSLFHISLAARENSCR